MGTIDVYSIPGLREPFSSLTHFAGAIVFAVLSVVLVKRARLRHHTISVAIMGISAVGLLSLSGAYHMLWPGAARDLMRRLDIASVFVLIAGTITPVHTILFRGRARWIPLVLVWTLAITGLVLRMVYYETLPTSAGTAAFVVLGWGGAITTVVLWRRHDWHFVRPLFWGGIAYTIGAVVLSTKWIVLIPGYICAHEIWHVAVLTGLGLHWHFVSGIVVNEGSLAGD